MKTNAIVKGESTPGADRKCCGSLVRFKITARRGKISAEITEMQVNCGDNLSCLRMVLKATDLKLNW